jgi:hypothetical protein
MDIIKIEIETHESNNETHERKNETHESNNETHEISKVCVSPSGNYVVTCSKDGKSIIGWTTKREKDFKKEESLVKNDAKVEEDHNYFEKEESLVENGANDKKDDEEGSLVEKGSHNLVINENPSTATRDYSLVMMKDKVHDMRVSDNKMVVLYTDNQENPIEIYNFGEENPNENKLKFKHSGGEIMFAMDGEHLVYYQKNQIFIYSLNTKINKLKLESIYRVHSDSVIKECGITDYTIWARTSHYLYLWNLHTLQKSSHRWNFLDNRLPERNYYYANIDSSIRMNINNNLILARDKGQNVIFSREFNAPIHYFKDKRFLMNGYLSVHSAKNKLLIYNIGDNKLPLSLCFEKIEMIYDYNSQTNKIYGLNTNNEIVTYDLNKYNWEKYSKEENEWHYYLDNDIDINDTIIDPDMKNIKNLLKNDNYKLKILFDKPILFHNRLYGWEIRKDSEVQSGFKIGITKKDMICSKEIYEPIKCTLLKNNALALILVKNERKILAIFKFYKNDIRLQYFTYLDKDDKKSNGDGKNTNDIAKKILNIINAIKNIFWPDSKHKNTSNGKNTKYVIVKKIKSKILKIINAIKNIFWSDSDDDEEFWLRYEDKKSEGESLPLGYISLIVKNKDGHLEKEWLKVITTDYFTLLKYGSNYLKIFIIGKDFHLVDSTYKKCIEFIKEDSEKNLNFLDIINSSITELISKYPEYLQKFNNDMLILLNPTKNGLIDSNHHVCSDRQMSCKRIPLLYSNFNFSFHPIFTVFYLINLFYFIPTLLYFVLCAIFLLIFRFILKLFRIYSLLTSIMLITISILYFTQNFILFIPLLFLIPLKYFIFNYNKRYDQSIYLTCAYNSLCCYPSKYSWVKELFYKPQSSIFIKTCQKGYFNKIHEEKKEYESIKKINIEIDNIDNLFNLLFVSINLYEYFLGTNDQIYNNNSAESGLDRRKEFYKDLNGEAIVDFKWKTFGRYYYFLIWLIFTAFQISFITGSLNLSFKTDHIQTQLYKTTIIIGFVQLYFELRQFIWDSIEYIHSIWNLFDLAAFLFPTITSILWVYSHIDIPNLAISLSCLFLNIKFLLFFRAFESFGIYFAVIFGVIRRIFSFLVILVITTASFALSFHLLLVDESPNDSTNIFISFQRSLLATYLYLSDTGSITGLASNTNNAIIIILMTIFSFLIVIYLMNLFIGLLNISIERDNDRASYIVQKAEILAEIELFYLLPFQRRWKHWFPDVIHYKVRRDVMRKYVDEAIKNEKWKSDGKKYREKVLRQIDMLDLINNHI